ncbi:Endonuclease/exonuclease/phosphatase [Baffinella frigidus]|nr:Endonuclease/exonuclease/phosphatase [Cryptophyta sp. CCMP2293]
MAKNAPAVKEDAAAEEAEEAEPVAGAKRGKKAAATKEPAAKKPRTTKAKVEAAKSEDPNADEAAPAAETPPKTKAKGKKAAAPAKAAVEGEEAVAAVAKPKKAAAVRTTIERSELKDPLGNPPGNFKIITWNVTTLRSLVDKNSALLLKLYAEQAPDLLLIQETKLNEADVPDYEKKLKDLLPGHSFHFCSSTGRKSYAGTLAIVKDGGSSGKAEKKQAEKKQGKTLHTFFGASKEQGAEGEAAAEGGGEGGVKPVGVTYGLPTMSEVDGPIAVEAALEGRTITVEYPNFFVIGVYVPNSGDTLVRLDFRTQVWDRRLEEYMQDLEAKHKKPVILCGDLNVAHLDSDIWNFDAKHIPKSAGTTPQERQSFSETLQKTGFKDAFRHFHGNDASGWFSYFSVRAGNRPVNRGLRLDYFVCSPSLFPADGAPAEGAAIVTGSTILPEFVALDHAACLLSVKC